MTACRDLLIPGMLHGLLRYALPGEIEFRKDPGCRNQRQDDRHDPPVIIGRRDVKLPVIVHEHVTLQEERHENTRPYTCRRHKGRVGRRRQDPSLIGIPGRQRYH